MPALRAYCALVAAALLLSGCSYPNGMLDDMFGPTPKTANPASAAAADHPSPPVTAAPLPNGQAPAAQATPAGPGNVTGTYVGQKVAELRSDVAALADSLDRHQQALAETRQALRQDAARYFGTVAGINARLQLGTTPGNPQMVAQWNDAQTMLDHMSDDIARLNSISNQAASDSSRASYLLDATRAAFTLQGAVDEDHADLHQIETRINTLNLAIDGLLGQLSDEISRQTTYVANERSNLVTLSLAIKNGQLYGPSLANRTFAPALASATAAPTRLTRAVLDRPLVTIRFDHPNVNYEQAVYTAVSRALERRPQARFELVAVTPDAGTPAQVALNTDASKHNAENVLRSLTGMGLPPDRVTLSAMSSPQVRSNEVRIYVR